MNPEYNKRIFINNYPKCPRCRVLQMQNPLDDICYICYRTKYYINIIQKNKFITNLDNYLNEKNINYLNFIFLYQFWILITQLISYSNKLKSS